MSEDPVTQEEASASRSPIRQVLQKRKNLIPLVSALVATLAVGLNLAYAVATDTADSQSIIFAAMILLLSAIAVSGVVEQEEILAQTRPALDALQATLQESNLKLSDLETKQSLGFSELQTTMYRRRRAAFVANAELPSLEMFVGDATEIFYAAGTASGLLTNAGLLIDWLSSGRNVKILIQDPENPGLHDLRMPCLMYDGEAYTAQIRANLARLDSLLNKKSTDGWTGELHVKLSSVTPTQTLALRDVSTSSGMIMGFLHLPYGDSISAPFFTLHPHDDSKWFRLFHERYYVQLWNDSKSHTPEPPSHESLAVDQSEPI